MPPSARRHGDHNPHPAAPHEPPRHHDHHPPLPRQGWGYPFPSYAKLAEVLGDNDTAYTAKVALDRAPDEVRVIADLLVRLFLEGGVNAFDTEPGDRR